MSTTRTTRTPRSPRTHRALALAGTAMLLGGTALAVAAPAQATDTASPSGSAILDPLMVERSCKTPGKSGTPSDAYYTSVVLRGSDSGLSTFTFDSMTVQKNPALTQITPKQVVVPARSTTTVTLQVQGSTNSANGPAVLHATVAQGGTTTQHGGTITSFLPMQSADCGVTYPSSTTKPWPVTNGKVVSLDFGGNPAYTPAAAQTGVASISAGGAASYALKSDGSAAAWRPDGDVPLPDGWTNLKAIDSDLAGSYTLAVTNDGTVLNDGGGLPHPQPLVGSTDIRTVSAGDQWAMGLKTDGTLVPGGITESGGPAWVPQGLDHVVQVIANYENFLALKADGTVAQWDILGEAPPAPADVNHIVSIASANDGGMVAALKDDGTVLTWAEGDAAATVRATGATRLAMAYDRTSPDDSRTHLYIQHQDGSVDDTVFFGGVFGETIPLPALKGATSLAANDFGVVALMPAA